MPHTGTAVARGPRVRLQDDRAGTDIFGKSSLEDAPASSEDLTYRPQYDEASPWGENWATGERRTVQIRGRGSERYTPPTRSTAARRRNERRYERAGFKADRAAMWAVLLGVMLIFAAVTSAHAATLHALVH